MAIIPKERDFTVSCCPHRTPPLFSASCLYPGWHFMTCILVNMTCAGLLCICVCWCVQVLMCVHSEGRGQPFCFEAGSLIALEFSKSAWLAGQRVPGICPSLPPEWDCKSTLPCLSVSFVCFVFHGFLGSNVGPAACKASTFVAKSLR